MGGNTPPPTSRRVVETLKILEMKGFGEPCSRVLKRAIWLKRERVANSAQGGTQPNCPNPAIQAVRSDTTLPTTRRSAMSWRARGASSKPYGGCSSGSTAPSRARANTEAI